MEVWIWVGVRQAVIRYVGSSLEDAVPVKRGTLRIRCFGTGWTHARSEVRVRAGGLWVWEVITVFGARQGAPWRATSIMHERPQPTYTVDVLVLHRHVIDAMDARQRS